MRNYLFNPFFTAYWDQLLGQSDAHLQRTGRSAEIPRTRSPGPQEKVWAGPGNKPNDRVAPPIMDNGAYVIANMVAKLAGKVL